MKLKQLLEQLDPVGETEKGKKVGVGQIRDIDNDGDIDSSDEYLAYRRKKVTQAVKGRDMNEGFESDDSVAQELLIFINNDADLYRQRKMPIMKNLARKMKKGVYDSSKAVKLWMYLVDAGAKKYADVHGSPGVRWHEMFPKVVRLTAAKELAEEFEDEVSVGSYDVDELSMREHRVVDIDKKKLKEMVRRTVQEQLKVRVESDPNDMLDRLREVMSDSQILDELMQAMSKSEAEENLQHIMDMWDIS